MACVVILARHGTTPEMPHPDGRTLDSVAVVEHWDRMRFLARTGALPPERARIHLEQNLILKPQS